MPELRSIAVAVDGSASSDQGLALALELAKLASASLTIVTVVPVHRVYRGPTEPVVQTNPEDRRYLFAMVSQQADRCRRAGLRTVVPQILEGSVVDELLRFIEDSRPDLFVLGARGLSATRRLLLGSVSDAIVHQARCPVLVARPEPAHAARKKVPDQP